MTSRLESILMDAQDFIESVIELKDMGIKLEESMNNNFKEMLFSIYMPPLNFQSYKQDPNIDDSDFQSFF